MSIPVYAMGNGGVSFLLSFAALAFAVMELHNNRCIHSHIAEYITIGSILLVATAEYLDFLAVGHPIVYAVCFYAGSMYLWGRLTERLSRWGGHFWLGYFLGLIGVIYVKVKGE